MGGFVAYAHRGENAATLQGDSVDYHRLAVEMLHGEYNGLTRPPVYPAFVAVIYAVVGPNPSLVFWFQALVLTITLLLVYKTCRRLQPTRPILAVLALAMCAMWPPFYQNVGMLLTENLSSLVVALAMWLGVVAYERASFSNVVFAGLSAGLLTLTKAVTIPYIVLLPLMLWFSDSVRTMSLSRRTLLAGLALMSGVLIVGPWTLRNYNVTGRFLPVTTLSGFNCLYGNSPDAYEVRGQSEWLQRHCIVYESTVDSREVDIDQQRMRQGLSLMAKQPVQTLRLFALKFSGLWLGTIGASPASLPPHTPHIGKFGIPKMSFVQVPMFLLAVLGWFVSDDGTRRRSRPILLLAVTWTAAYVFLYSERRYMLPMVFFQFFFVASGLVWLKEKMFARSPKGSVSEC